MDQDYVLPSATVLFLRRPLHTHTLPYFSFPVYGARPCVIRHPRQPRDTRSVSFTGKAVRYFVPVTAAAVSLSLSRVRRDEPISQPAIRNRRTGERSPCVIHPPSGVTITLRTLK